MLGTFSKDIGTKNIFSESNTERNTEIDELLSQSGCAIFIFSHTLSQLYSVGRYINYCIKLHQFNKYIPIKISYFKTGTQTYRSFFNGNIARQRPKAQFPQYTFYGNNAGYSGFS